MFIADSDQTSSDFTAALVSHADTSTVIVSCPLNSNTLLPAPNADAPESSHEEGADAQESARCRMFRVAPQSTQPVRRMESASTDRRSAPAQERMREEDM